MATKSGNYVLLDDGTWAQQVQIAGTDASSSSTGALGVNVKQSDAIVPTDMQARLINTNAAQAAVAVAPSSNNTQSTWTLVPDGMSEFINNLTIDAALANVYMTVYWSEDGTTTTGRTQPTVSNSIAATQKTSTQWFPIGGTYYKTDIFNGDTALHTCSANIKFRA
jgi:hypothetical protein